MDQHYRVIVAFILSMLIIGVWQHFFASTPAVVKTKQITEIATTSEDSDVVEGKIDAPPKDRDLLVEGGYMENLRVKIENDYLKGSINLVGARLDDMELVKYKQDIKAESKNVVLLSPDNTIHPYFIDFHCLTGGKNDSSDIELPTANTIWKADRSMLSSNESINLTWANKRGIKFIINIALDDRYMFYVKYIVDSNMAISIPMHVTTAIERSRGDKGVNNFILHEGAVTVADGKLQEVSFEKLQDKKKVEYVNTRVDWTGFSDKYWLVAVMPITTNISHARLSNYVPHNTHQAHFRASLISPRTLKPQSGPLVISESKLFVGAKNLELLEIYSREHDIKLFDRAVDFGILYFITKPIFLFLNYLYHLLSNFGLAIALLTVIIKFLLFPLAYAGFKNMDRLKILQPQITKLRAMHEKNPMVLQKAMMELYKKEKINPLSGCLPLILQIPVFFALYKVLYVTIEMRQAPLGLWIHDLSVADPTSIFNLFGLISWQPPSWLMVGVLPILMSITMYIQQSFSVQLADPVQAKTMKFLPLIFLFIFASFPSGLLLYWTWSNILSIMQQQLIRKLAK
ncbi:Membrane protein insertase YidC [Alphaproteobacteria bacterium]